MRGLIFFSINGLKSQFDNKGDVMISYFPKVIGSIQLIFTYVKLMDQKLDLTLRFKSVILFFQNEWVCLMSQHTAEKCLKSMIYLTEGNNDFNHQLRSLTSRLLNYTNVEQTEALDGLRELTESLSAVGAYRGTFLFQTTSKS